MTNPFERHLDLADALDDIDESDIAKNKIRQRSAYQLVRTTARLKALENRRS